MTIQTLLAALFLAVAAGLPPAWAGPGHDHDHDHGAAAAPAGPALPRFAAVSETFELVGVLEGRRLQLYLDRTADNAPVTGAQIELEVAGAPLPVTPHGDTYDVMLPAEPTPGVLPITATVTAGQDVDLLAGELEIAGPAAAETAPHGPSWKALAAWAGAAALAVLALSAAALRLRRRAATGAAA